MIEIVEEKEEKKKKIIKKPLTINESNWNKILGCSNSKQNNAVLPEVIVVKQKEVSGMEEIIAMDSDYQLNSKIERMKCVLNTLGPKLPDKGAKFRKNLQLYEAERDRRVRDRALKEAECGKSTQSQTSGEEYFMHLYYIWDFILQYMDISKDRGVKLDACNGSSSETPSPKDQSQSEFGKLFGKELDKKPNCSTHISVSLLHKGHPQSGGSNHQNTISNGLLSNKRRKESKADSRQSPFKIPRNSSRVGNEHRVSIDSSSFYSPKEDGKFSSNFPKRRKLSQAQPALRSRNKKRETVVLLDEEDCHPEETTQEEDEPVGRMEAKLYYPSRDDPESVELCYSDIKFLAPEAFLSSAIMNFYIRYLQRPVSATGRSRSDYHFFNTFFYGKLKEAVSCKTNDKDLLFSKFRRWWKGVNIFEKSYILLPIHESLHWSLVIICLPNKDDESGPIILHLDSLGYHLSSQIFQNVRR
ncbi:hypothetical protein IFM89_036011 [Coptis chinensis]|uniref:Ubiquitin-like protease family profile domain-containing protein n=1 Tax=Coptis chinensis TaxID=261450 RepID=A0A835IQ20_9MAGN|nr:hypothetical protein IFM89_036011 [Coptis chinensis]